MTNLLLESTSLNIMNLIPKKVSAKYSSRRLDVPCFVMNKNAWRIYCRVFCGVGEHRSKSKQDRKNMSTKIGLQICIFSIKSSLVIN